MSGRYLPKFQTKVHPEIFREIKVEIDALCFAEGFGYTIEFDPETSAMTGRIMFDAPGCSKKFQQFYKIVKENYVSED